MIQRKKKKYNWEFLFLGANIDAIEAANSFGINKDRAVNYHSDSEGTLLNYEVLSDAISSFRSSMPLNDNWKQRIDDDFYARETKPKKS